MVSDCYSTREVIERSGATARQLQWWDEHRLIRPDRIGRKRVYSSTDLADIVVVLELRRRHISLQAVRRALRFLKKELGARFADLISDEISHPLRDYHLLIDGQRLYLETDSRQIFELLRNSEQAVLLISLSAAASRLRLPGEVLEKPLLEQSAAAAVPPSKKTVTRAGSSPGRKEVAVS